MQPPPEPRATQLAGLGLAAGLVLWASFAAGEESCAVRVEPTTDPAWNEAAAGVQARLARRSEPGDCLAVGIEVRADGSAELAFTTKDGRVARRALRSPAELGPALEALVVTLPPPESTGTETDTAGAPTATTAPSMATATDAPSDPAPSTTPRARSTARIPANGSAREPRPGAAPRDEATPIEVHVEVGATAGARTVWQPSAFVAPTLAMVAGVQLERWYVGVGGSFAPLHAPIAIEVPAGFRRTALAGVLEAGHTFAIGPADLDVLGAIGVQDVGESAGTDRVARSSIATVQPQAGARVRASWTRDERVRWLGGVGFDTVLGSLQAQSTALRGLPPLARFAASLELGVEFACL